MKFIYYLMIALSGTSLYSVCHHKPKPKPHSKPVQQENISKQEIQQTIFEIIEQPKPEIIKPQESILEETKPVAELQVSLQTESENKIAEQVQNPEIKELSSIMPKKVIVGSSALLFMASAIVHYFASSSLHNKLRIIQDS